jgi:hypothetical protein
MPCVQATAEVMAAIQHLNEAEQQSRFTLDLASLTLSVARDVFPVTLAEGRRRQFRDGTWDPTAVLLDAGDTIERTLATL